MEPTVSQRQNTGMMLPSPQTVILPSFYLAPTAYFAALFHADSALVEIQEHYRKQSYRSRCIIAGANGPLPLSIPVEKPNTLKCAIKDIQIADHGNWQHLHWNAIVSAYNSTPFFQYFEDDFRPYYEKKFTFLHDFNEGLRLLITDLLGIETPCNHTTEYVASPLPHSLDLRDLLDPKKPSTYEMTPYYQVFTEKHGFMSNLSIVDLLFNLGNEARLYLIKHPFQATINL